MKKIKLYTTEDRMTLVLYAGLLEAEGFDVEVRNDLQGAMGGLPTDRCWPEIWVAERHQDAASRTLERIRAGADQAGGEPWDCSCGETMEPQFEVCWSCGAERP